jgi:hypothetical protein
MPILRMPRRNASNNLNMTSDRRARCRARKITRARRVARDSAHHDECGRARSCANRGIRRTTNVVHKPNRARDPRQLDGDRRLDPFVGARSRGSSSRSTGPFPGCMKRRTSTGTPPGLPQKITSTSGGMADAPDLGSGAARRESSSLSSCTRTEVEKPLQKSDRSA